MRVLPEHKVTYPVARERALRYLASRESSLHYRDLTKANMIGNAIWPDSTLRSQGLGGAASRILKRMEKEGLVRWSSSQEDWGWKLTSAGRVEAQFELSS